MSVIPQPTTVYKICPVCEGVSYSNMQDAAWFCPYCDCNLQQHTAFMMELLVAG